MTSDATFKQALEDAKIAATFYNGLLQQGVQPTPAAQITASYLSSVILSRKFDPEAGDGKEPWKP